MAECLSYNKLSLFLGISVVKIVDAVQVHVLCVPGKGRLPAAKVQVGRVHPADLDTIVLQNEYLFIIIYKLK